LNPLESARLTLTLQAREQALHFGTGRPCRLCGRAMGRQRLGVLAQAGSKVEL